MPCLLINQLVFVAEKAKDVLHKTWCMAMNERRHCLIKELCCQTRI